MSKWIVTLKMLVSYPWDTEYPWLQDLDCWYDVTDKAQCQNNAILYSIVCNCRYLRIEPILILLKVLK